MRSLLHKSSIPYGAIIAASCLLFVIIGISTTTARAQASPNVSQSGQRLITIHDNGQDKAILTSASTLRQAFTESAIRLDANDLVEPGLDDTLVANNYEVNVYRARPVTIIDGAVRQKVMSAYRTSQQIVTHAGMKLHDEDKTAMNMTTDMVGDGAGVQLTIDRATPFTLVLYGKKTDAYTQATTVADMLKEKNITIAASDTLSVDKTVSMTSGMTIELWRNGKQTVNEDQDITFPVEQVQDADQPVGYKKITTPGVNGKKTVTYEIEMKNGHEVSRKEIQSVVTSQPQKQVEDVGSKPSFSGDFANALAKLRSCEGGYNSFNPAGYYGAYQFDRQTWGTVADASSYGHATPGEQDQAARNLYVRRGWSPWPNCGRGLPDTYR